MSVLVTGVSRRIGIAWTIAERLQRAGWAVDATGWRLVAALTAREAGL